MKGDKFNFVVAFALVVCSITIFLLQIVFRGGSHFISTLVISILIAVVIGLGMFFYFKNINRYSGENPFLAHLKVYMRLLLGVVIATMIISLFFDIKSDVGRLIAMHIGIGLLILLSLGFVLAMLISLFFKLKKRNNKSK